MRSPSVKARIPPPPLVVLLVMVVLVRVVGATWCIARNNVSDQALQTALDYACGAIADCAPIQSSGLCYLPNTVQSHASYAFNSYYQRKAMEPGSCDFSGTAAISITDPSYGSCVYPSSPSTAGGIVTPTTPTTMTPPTIGSFSPSSFGPPVPNTDASKASFSLFTGYSFVFHLLHSLAMIFFIFM